MDLFSKGNILKKIFRIVPIGCILPWLLLSVCSYPPVPEDQDLVELERIWQYCKAFSLYSDRVPDHSTLITYSDPLTLVFSFYDTLYSHWKNETYFYSIYTPVYSSIFGRCNPGQRENFKFIKQREGETVFFTQITDSTGYLYIKEFELNTYDEFLRINAPIGSLQNIIINLRNNPGGYVHVTQAIIDHFLPVNVPYLSVKKRRISIDTGTVDTTWVSSETDSIWGNKKIVILMDSLSASASEILTIALHDGLPQESIYLIGQKSYGKAIGQVRFHMLNDAGLQLTMMKFFPISSMNYHETGINPDLTFNGPFNTNELLEAGKWLESGFENKASLATLNAIVSEFNSHKLFYKLPGCYRVINQDELPF